MSRCALCPEWRVPYKYRYHQINALDVLQRMSLQNNGRNQAFRKRINWIMSAWHDTKNLTTLKFWNRDQQTVADYWTLLNWCTSYQNMFKSNWYTELRKWSQSCRARSRLLINHINIGSFRLKATWVKKTCKIQVLALKKYREDCNVVAFET